MGRKDKRKELFLQKRKRKPKKNDGMFGSKKRMLQTGDNRARDSNQTPNFQAYNVQVSCDPQASQSHNKDEEVGIQIKNSLLKLRRQSDSSQDNTPALQLDVFPEEVTSTDPEFIDESQPPEDEDSDNHENEKKPVKRKRPKKEVPLKKKVKRNPRRLTVIRKELEEARKAAQKAPNIEKVFLKSGFQETNTEDNRTSCPTDVKSTPTDIPCSLDHKEQLYEFGKYVAEQLMAFDNTDVQAAQTEIKEVLQKFRLKYKIMQCLSKPSTSNQQKSGSSATKVNGTGQTVTQSSSSFSKSTVKTSTQTREANNFDPPVLQVPESILQPTPATTNSGLLNVGTGSSEVPLSLVLVPIANPPGFLLSTGRVNADGTVTQPGLILKSHLAQAELPPTSTTVSQSAISQLDANMVATHPGMAQGSVGILPTQQGLSQGSFGMTGPQPGSSQENLFGATGSHIVGIVDSSEDPDTLIVKLEPDDDDEL